MKSDISPAPWRWTDTETPGDMGGIIAADGSLVCEFGDSTQYYPTEGTPPTAANRALMLAAPELLDAARAVLASIDSGDANDFAALRRLRVAIEKAEG